MRRVLFIMIHRLLRDLHFRVHPLLMPGIRIPVVLGKTGAGNMEPDPVPFKEHIGRGHHVDVEFIHRAWFHQFFRTLYILPKPGPDNPFGQVIRSPVRVYISQADDKIRIRS